MPAQTWLCSPIDGAQVTALRCHTQAEVEASIARAAQAFLVWRDVPAPQRGILVRLFGEALRVLQEPLAYLVTIECGKILAEARGEVQEMIDMCDFAVGLSRQLYGLTIASERANHRMFEQWHPLGPVGCITAFNFPVAVWAWNAALALVCGDPVVWKPSHQTPLTAIAVQHIVNRVLEPAPAWPGRAASCSGHAMWGTGCAADIRAAAHLRHRQHRDGQGRRHYRRPAPRPRSAGAWRQQRSDLDRSADLDLALRAVLFAAVGTAGQRCTTLRRPAHVHVSIADTSHTAKLAAAYKSIQPGNPWEDGVLLGPLIRQSAADQFETAIAAAQQQGGKILAGGSRIQRPGYYVQPTLIAANPRMEIVKQETFAPILYALPYKTLDEAIALHNAVPQGLSSAIFTDRFQDAESFLSAAGSDCGIANVNIGTSGAEIGGAFGGEKETGGGREAGSDAWKAYMRRQTRTTYYGTTPPALAQSLRFEVG